jgi:hypothetical protein
MMFRDGSGSALIQSAHTEALAAADRMDIMCFAAGNRRSPVVEECVPADAAASSSAALPTLTDVAQVHHLSEKEARRGYPVRVKAVVTFFAPSGRNLNVQDSTDAIYVSVMDRPVPDDLRLGMDVEIQGFSGPGDFAPVITEPTIRILGPGTLPEPLHPSVDELFTGSVDSRSVEVEGTVYSVGSSYGKPLIGVRSGRYEWSLWLDGDLPLPDSLMYSRVRATGVYAPRFNLRRQVLGMIVRVPDATFIHP